jgi:hypothetical protein
MFNLLLSVTLDPLHQALHSCVLLLPQIITLTLHRLHHLLLVLVQLVHLLLVRLHAHELSVIILLNTKENLLLVSQRDEVLLRLVLHLFPDFLYQRSLLVVLLRAHVLDQLERCSLVARHVFVPGAGELLKLVLLRIFNVKQLFFLGDPHVLLLALLLRLAELLKLRFHLLGR